MFKVDGKRALRDLQTLARIGKFKSGVNRPIFSPQDMKARNWLVDRLGEVGLETEIDGIGNVIGRSPRASKVFLLGSHIESQPKAGWLDGALGVVYGLEVARALNEAGIDAAIGVDVAAWADEEGYFGHYLGSLSFCKGLSEETIDAAVDRGGRGSLRSMLEHVGLADRPRPRLDKARTLGYLEAHIEQGPVLDRSGDRIGVVTAIVGSWQYRVEFAGEQNHAGTTPMAIRADAGQAMCEFRTALDAKFRTIASPQTVWTVSRMTVEPGIQSIIPGKAEMLLQIRDTDRKLMEALDREIFALADKMSAAGPCTVTAHAASKSMPATMDARLQDALTSAADSLAPGAWRSMHSGAGHDAQILALQVPSAMMFVPSINGISHHWLEDTKHDDIVLGCNVFGTAVASLIAEASRKSALLSASA